MQSYEQSYEQKARSKFGITWDIGSRRIWDNRLFRIENDTHILAVPMIGLIKRNVVRGGVAGCCRQGARALHWRHSA